MNEMRASTQSSWYSKLFKRRGGASEKGINNKQDIKDNEQDFPISEIHNAVI